MLTWLNQSLKIRLADGTVRHIGLAKSKIDKMINSEFTSHDTEEYKYLNDYPENIDIELLNKLTITRLEDSKAVETITFGKPKFDLNGDFVITTCRSEIMRVIRMSERNK